MGLDRRTVYRWRENPKFEAMFQAADLEITELLEQSALQDAVKGNTVLKIFLLKSRNPEKYGDRLRVGIDVGEIKKMVEHVVSIINAKLPKCCPGCKTQLDLAGGIADELMRLSDTLKPGGKVKA